MFDIVKANSTSGKEVETMKKLILCLLIAFVHLTIGTSHDGLADDTINPWDALMKARSLKCSFGPGISTGWKADEPKPEDARFDGVVYLKDIDFQAGGARLLDKKAPTDISATLSPLAANFIEKTGMGNISVITVYPYYLKGSQVYPAVWSSHFYLADGPLTSQYYGTCELWE